MKKSKFVSIILSIAMCLSMASGVITTSAEEIDEKLYTLQELFDMNDEEFFKLDNDYIDGSYGFDYAYYNQAKRDFENVAISGQLYMSVSYGYNPTASYHPKKEYQANVTEEKMAELIGDTVKYEITSPIYFESDVNSENYVYYGNIFSIIFPEYQLSAKTNNVSDKQIIEFAKCCYCVNQVMSLLYYWTGTDLLSAPAETTIGDINFDKKVDKTDAMYINKGLTGEYKLTKGQKKLGDVNGDGKFDILDSVAIRIQLMSETEQTAIKPAIEELKTAKSAIPGDISKSNNIDLQDSIIIAKSLVGSVKLSKSEELIADYDANGKVDLHDAIDIAKFLLKK